MKFISAEDAATLVDDGDAVLISGSGGGHSVPECLLAALGNRFRNQGVPRNLTAISVVGVGDRISLGADHLGQKGMTSRSITSALIDSPSLMKMAANDEIEAYTFPQGVLSQLMREMAAGRPGLITKPGLNNYVDPRQPGSCPIPVS